MKMMMKAIANKYCYRENEFCSDREDRFFSSILHTRALRALQKRNREKNKGTMAKALRTQWASQWPSQCRSACLRSSSYFSDSRGLRAAVCRTAAVKLDKELAGWNFTVCFDWHSLASSLGDLSVISCQPFFIGSKAAGTFRYYWVI